MDYRGHVPDSKKIVEITGGTVHEVVVNKLLYPLITAGVIPILTGVPELCCDRTSFVK